MTASEGAEQLIVEVVAVRDDYDRRVLERRFDNQAASSAWLFQTPSFATWFRTVAVDLPG